MSRKTNVKNFIRGGQITLHNFRMIKQIMGKVVFAVVIVFIIINAWWFFWKTSSYDRYAYRKWLYAHVMVVINSKAKQSFLQPDGEEYQVYSHDILSSEPIKATVHKIKAVMLDGLLVGGLIYILVFILISVWLKRRGKDQTEDKRLKGDYLGEVEDIKKITKDKKISAKWDIGLEKLPIPPWAELQHIFMHGTTGTGKSTTIKEILDHIRKCGDRAIIYDKSCNLVKQFYQPKIDALMNVLDERGVDWRMWEEFRDKSDIESIAAALMPMPPSTQDPFWVNAARTIFAAAANRMRKKVKNPKILPLLRYLLTADINELQSLLKGTEAESLISEKTEKTAISIKSVMATYLKSLCYIKDGDNKNKPFSIRKWIQDDSSNQWLFISSQGDKHESLKPLITAWLDIAVNALLSLPENENRRIWIILDELTSLQQLPYLTTALSEARKFGGCFVVGIQSYAQLGKVYGHDGAKEISSLLNTRFMFRQPDPDIAAWSARNLGETIIREVREGLSYGANTIRDGVSLNHVERNKPVVSFSEIMNLDDLACYVRLPGSYPITKININYVKRSDKNIPFVQRKIEHDDLRSEVEDLVEHFDAIDAEKPQKKAQSKTQKINKNPSEKEKTELSEDIDEQSLDV